jgi:hypothetical protein
VPADAIRAALACGGLGSAASLDPGQANQKWAAPKTMKPPIEPFVPKKDGVFKNPRKLHHKLMVIDEQTSTRAASATPSPPTTTTA